MHRDTTNTVFFRITTAVSKLALLIAAVLPLCAVPLSTEAQEARAAIGGRVTDPQGAAVPEAIVARHMDIDVVGISCITNLAAGVSDQPVDHSLVIATGERVRAQFTELLRRVIRRLDL